MEKTLPIIKEPNKTLRARAGNVPLDSIRSRFIQSLIARMKETLGKTSDGVGLAAPQVAESLRIFIISEEAEEIDRNERAKDQKKEIDGGKENAAIPEKREWKYYVFINPTAKKSSKRKILGPEGCLSVPGTFGDVERNEKITVEAHDENGQKFTRGASRFFARVIQHELDHLDGVLFIDKARGLVEGIESSPQNK